MVSGEHTVLKVVQDHVCKKYPTKVRGIMGPEPEDVKEMVILNRVVQWRCHRLTLEADSRHVEVLLLELGLETSKGAHCVHVDHKVEEGDEVALSREETSRFRSIAARCNFLAADRLDIQFVCKEICRRMSAPTLGDWKLVKKLVRYLAAHRRKVLHFRVQAPPQHLDVVVDSDYAGCRRTRRSTNGGMAMWGSHILKTWSTTQSVVALSSGEAEFYSLVRGACEGMGILALNRDIGGDVAQMVASTDSAAAKGIASRRGIGKVRHLDTRTLWVQDLMCKGTMRVKKLDGEQNPADILTKYLGAAKLQHLMSKIDLYDEQGRSNLIPGLHRSG